VGFHRRRSLTPQEAGILGLIGFVTILIAGISVGANIAISRIVSGGGGFFVAREGAQAFLFEHTDPYSGTVARLSQELAYGRVANNNEDPYFLTIPFYLLPFYFPFALISDNAVARGIWMFLNEAALIGMALLCLQLIGWRPNRFFLIIYSLVSIFSYYSVAALLDGTSVIINGLLFLAILFAYGLGQDEMTGLLLVLTLFNWEVGSLFFLLIIWKIISDKRWRVLYGFGMTLIILVVFSLLIYPGWIYPFVIAVVANLRAQFGMTSTAVFLRLFPAYGHTISQGVVLLGIILFVYEGIATLRSDFRRLIWTACLILAITPLMGFRTDLSNLVVLFPSVALIFSATTDRWRTGYWLTGLLLLLVLLVPWGLFVRWYSLQNQKLNDYLFLFYPLFTILGLYWTRWWFMNPPRTWLEQMRATRK
jgi:hypothetical protein